MRTRTFAGMLAAGLLALTTGAPAVSAQSGGMYRWQDQNGGVRYSQGLDSVPEPFRAQAVRVGGTPEPAPAAPVRPRADRSQGPARPEPPEITPAQARELERMLEGMAEAMAKGLESAFSDLPRQLESAAPPRGRSMPPARPGPR